MTDPNRDTDYQCFIGTHAAAISECYIYGTTFNAAARTSGHAYADPSTGAAIDGQTDESDPDRLAADLMTRMGSSVVTAASPATQWGWAMAVAGICLSQFALGVCEDTTIWSPGNNVPDIAEHDAAAIVAGRPAGLTYMTGAEKLASGVSHGWYNLLPYSATGNCAGLTPDGKHCDEYPYYATVQGGPPDGDLQFVNGTQNTNEGSWRRAFLVSVCHLDTATGDDRNFLVLPDPVLFPTIGWCKL